jgi:hypothetical protein
LPWPGQGSYSLENRTRSLVHMREGNEQGSFGRHLAPLGTISRGCQRAEP